MTTYREADMHSSSRIGLTTLLIIGSLLLASLPPCAPAGDVTFFSKTYIRKTQKPQVFTDTFTCSQPGSNISLTAKNGRNGSYRVSSALIWINGKQIFRASDFNNQVNSLTRSVILKTTNEIKVELRGKPGDFIAITITGSDTNTPPVANAGPDQTAFVSKTVTLDGSKSSDVDGDSLTFLWSFTSVPGGSAASLSNPNAVTPAFVVDHAGTYVIQLIVNDGTVSSTPDTVTITTSNSGPVANAGPDQTAFVSQTVTLDGGKSSDVDGDSLTFLWSFLLVPSGSTAILSNPAAVNPTFKVDLPGTYEVQLIVNDGKADSQPDAVVITTVNSKPVADAGPDQTAFVTQTVTLDGSGSSDVDSNALTYKWSFSSNPAGSAAVISNPSDVKPTFTVDKPGTYVVQLIVNDGSVDSTPDSMTITTLNSKPVANAGLNQTVQVGDTATLDGSKSTDVDGDLLSYTWSFVSLPAGSAATLSDPESVRPSFTVDKPGSYVVQLIVKDAVTDSDPATVTITTENSPPVADAGPDQTVYVTDTVQLDGSKSKDADGDPLTYRWSFTSTPAGSTPTILNPSDVNPTFVVDRPGTYVIQLTVNDGIVSSTPDTVTITTSNSKPVANAGPDQNDVIAGMTVDLNGSASSDADKDPLSYKWSFISIPDPSAASLSGDETVSPSFIADLAGIYVAQLTVNDGTVDSAPDTVAITASPRMVSVPNVVGMAQAAAESAITAAGLTVGTISHANSATVPAGDVISQNPAAGATLAENSFVDLVISTGPVMVTVPYVTGMTQADAGSAITLASLTVGTITTANSSMVPAGHVISQDPNAGSSVAQGSAVALWISLGPVMIAVPNVVDMTQTAAESAIKAATLTIGTITTANSSSVPAGYVISQIPIAGSSVAQGSAVALWISLGPVMVAVPNVVDMTQTAAESAITAATLTVGTITAVNSSSVPAGHVISQIPLAGSSVPQGSAVALWISLGPVMVAVPNVVGMTQTAAGSALTAADLTIGTITTANSSVVPVGQVISQDPIAGSSVPQGSAVALLISLGPAGLPPDPVTVAPPIDPSVATTVARETEFLYTGQTRYRQVLLRGL